MKVNEFVEVNTRMAQAVNFKRQKVLQMVTFNVYHIIGSVYPTDEPEQTKSSYWQQSRKFVSEYDDQ